MSRGLKIGIGLMITGTLFQIVPIIYRAGVRREAEFDKARAARVEAAKLEVPPSRDFQVLHEEVPEGWSNASMYVLIHKPTDQCFIALRHPVSPGMSLSPAAPVLCQHYLRLERTK